MKKGEKEAKRGILIQFPDVWESPLQFNYCDINIWWPLVKSVL